MNKLYGNVTVQDQTALQNFQSRTDAPNSLEAFPDFLQNDREPTLPSGGLHPPDPPRKRNEAYTKIIKYIYNFLKVEFIKKKKTYKKG